MTFQSQLSSNQLARLMFLRHIQRPTFYFNAITSSILIAYAILYDIFVILYVAWVPFVLYLVFGFYQARQSALDKDHPLLLPTTYTFSEKGISISTPRSKGHLEWKYIVGMKHVIGCYVITLTNGQIVVISEESVAAHQKDIFLQFFLTNIKKTK